MCRWVVVEPSMGLRFLAWATGKLSCHLPRRLGEAVLQEEVRLLLATSVRQVQVSVRPLVIRVCSLRRKPGREVLTWALSANKGIQSHKGGEVYKRRGPGSSSGGPNSKISATGD